MLSRIVRGVFVICFLLSGWAARAAEQPNIVFILADDLGWPHLGCYGAEHYETPNIDRLAGQGMRFTDFYAAGAVCSPTRASIQSGQYQARLGITDYIPGHKFPHEQLTPPAIADHLPLEIVTPAEALKSAGYATGYFGKWHLGKDDAQGPSQQGFDEAIVSSGGHFAPRFRTTPKQEIPDGTYLGDYLTDQSIRFVTEHKEGPFFVQLSHYLVHLPMQAKEQTIAKYRARTPPEGTFNPTYAAMIEHLDDSVGRILTTLDDLGIADNTVVIFTSDNGGLHQGAGGGPIISDNLPLRSEKGSLYEGGIRVPLIVRWPGVVQAGSTCPEPAISIDFWPTLAEMGGAQQSQHQRSDGLSLVKLLQGADSRLGRDALYFHYPHYHHSRPAGAIRMRDWKLIEFFDTGECELYRVSQDLGETTDLASQNQSVTADMKQRLRDWRDSVGAAMPMRNPDHDPDRAEFEPAP